MGDLVNTLALPISQRDHVQGAMTAAIALVQYGDYQCPHCASIYPVIQTLQQQLGEQLCFVYRHFPCPEIHPDAQHAAESAEAAATQGKFWQMHDCLSVNHQALNNGYLVEYAIALKLDIEQFLREVTSDRYVQRIQEDVESGKASGVMTTPTLFINGYRYRDRLDQRTLLNALQATV
ncbi:MAG: DsbA family protein [Leptolyngbyaceae cyanobacterium SL_7_1]|nr:DsbA family protein [Leptolyngbyaceae cyanobacterium SL_7_1]